MAPSEAILYKKLDELETEVDLLEDHEEQYRPHPRAASIRSKLAFLQSLFAAESGAAFSGVAARLSRISDRLAALDDPETTIFEPTENSKPVVGINHILLRKNLEELESMANAISIGSLQPLWHPNSAKILSKLAFTKSLLAAEAQSEHLSVGARLLAVEEAFRRLDATDTTPPSCSRTSSCHIEEVDAEAMAPLLVSLRRKIDDLEQGGEVCDDVRRKIGFLKSLLAAEMKYKGGEKLECFGSIVKKLSSIESKFTDRHQYFDNEDDANTGNLSSPCSCTSSCFDVGLEKEMEIGEEEEDESVSCANKTEDACSVDTLEVVERKSETANSEKGSVVVAVSCGSRRFDKLRAVGLVMAVVAVAAGVLVGRYFSEVKLVSLAPT